MSRLRPLPIAFLLLLLLLSACLRSTDDLPAPGEGVLLTGVVVQRDPVSGELSGVKDARINALGVSIAATTDQRGFFQLQRLPLGRIRLRIERRALGEQPARARLLDPVVALVEGQVIDLGEIELLESGGLEGFVGRDVGLSQPAPAGGALIVAAETAFKSVAGEDGEFVLAGLPEGVVDVIAFAPGHYPGRIAGVRVASGIRGRLEDLVLQTAPSDLMIDVAGSAIVAGSADSSGISIEFIDETDPARVVGATTNAAGNYSVSLALGVYRARFAKAGYVSVELSGIAVIREGVIGLVAVRLDVPGENDLDGDGIPDDRDPDRDNDGCPNDQDQFPDDAFACLDTDGDGIADELDPDDDNDTLSDALETSSGRLGFPTNPLRSDTDGDGVPDQTDNCPTVQNAGQENSDLGPRGDACEFSGEGPEVSGVDPGSGKVGDLIRILGSNFVSGEPSFVRFGDGALAVPTNITATEMFVQVPPGAETGPLTVYLPNGIDTSSVTFTFRAPPELVRFEPLIARRGAVVAVIGRRFVPEELAGFVNGFEAALVPGANGLIEEYLAPNGERLDLVRLRIPNTASGLVAVATRDGVAMSANALTVLGGPTIFDVAPNPTSRGSTVLITGTGFSTEDTGGSLRVRFSGSSTTVPVLEPFSDGSLRAEVPADAEASGFVYVLHPAGTATSPRPLVVDENVAYVTRIEPSLAMSGETVTLFGSNLAGATNVQLADGTNVVPSASSLTQITFVVPVNAAPGPLAITVPSGPFTTNTRLRILRRTTGGTLREGGGFNHDGSTFFSTLFGDGYEFDAVTLAQRGSPIPLPIPVDQNLDFSVAPNGTWGVLMLTQSNETYVVSLPGFALLFSCDEVPEPGRGRRHSALRFDNLSERAYASDPVSVAAGDAILMIDRVEQSCELLAPDATADYRGILSASPTELIVADATRGIGSLSVNRSFAFGTFIQPIQGPAVPQDRLFWAPANAFIYGVEPLVRIDPRAITPPVVLDGTVDLEATQSRDLRWMVASTAIIDLETGRTARVEPSITSIAGVIWHPTENIFISGHPAAPATRWEILD
jgi:hypothetical protein